MCRILVGADRYASTEPAANTPRSSIPRGWWRRASSLRWAASATVMTMLSPRRSRSLQGRDHPSARAMAVIRSRRVRDAGLGGLVQQPAALGAHRQHPAGRSRGTLLRHAGTTCHGGVNSTKWLPTNHREAVKPTVRAQRLNYFDEAVSAQIRSPESKATLLTAFMSHLAPSILGLPPGSRCAYSSSSLNG